MARKIFVHRPFARESAPEVVNNINLVKKNVVFSFDHDAQVLPGHWKFMAKCLGGVSDLPWTVVPQAVSSIEVIFCEVWVACHLIELNVCFCFVLPLVVPCELKADFKMYHSLLCTLLVYPVHNLGRDSKKNIRVSFALVILLSFSTFPEAH